MEFNNQEIETIKFNGQDVEQVLFNGQEVWSSWPDIPSPNYSGLSLPTNLYTKGTTQTITLGSDQTTNNSLINAAFNAVPKWQPHLTTGTITNDYIMHEIVINAGLGKPVSSFPGIVIGRNILYRIIGELDWTASDMPNFGTASSNFGSDPYYSGVGWIIVQGTIKCSISALMLDTGSKGNTSPASISLLSSSENYSMYIDANTITHDITLNVSLRKDPGYDLLDGAKLFVIASGPAYNAKVTVNLTNPNNYTDAVGIYPCSTTSSSGVIRAKNCLFKVNVANNANLTPGCLDIFINGNTYGKSLLDDCDIDYTIHSPYSNEVFTFYEHNVTLFNYNPQYIRLNSLNVNRTLKIRRSDPVPESMANKAVKFPVNLYIPHANENFINFEALKEGTTNEYIPVKMKNLGFVD